MSPFRTVLITTLRPSSCRPRGFTALESLLLLVIFINGWVIAAHFLEQQVQDTVATATARQLKTVSHQSYQWVLDHWQPLHQQFEESQPLESLNLLPLLLLSHRLPTQNPYQQRYQIQLIPAANQWQLWVTTHGGSPIPLRSCRQISAQVGVTAGYLTQNPTAAWIVKGWQGLWELGWPDALGTMPQAGHLAMLQTVDLPQLTSTHQLLSRKPLASIAKPNQLNTDLHLNNHQLTFKNQQQQSQFSNQQWLFSQGSPSLQAIKLTAHDVTVENSLLLGESAQKTLRLHHFLFALSDTTEQQRVNPLRIVKQAYRFLAPKRVTQTYLQLREPQCASQIHQFWGKLPYHERSPQESSPEALKNFADSVCQEAPDNQGALGRLFLVGSSAITEPAALFICSKSPHGVAAFQLNTIHGYRHQHVSSPAHDLTRTQTHAIRIKLPEMLSNAKEASQCLSLLNKILQHIVFFDQAAKMYSRLKLQCSVKVEKNKLKGELKSNNLLQHLSNDTFKELFKIYCEPLPSKPPKVNNYTTYDEVKNLDPSSLIPNYQSYSTHITAYQSLYETLNQVTIKLNFKESYNEKKSNRLNDFIQEIKDNFDHGNPFIKKIFMDSLIKLQREHPQWIEQQTNPYPSILGIDLPQTIEDIKQAEEILSLLLIILDKIEEKTLIFSTQKNFIDNKWMRIMEEDSQFYHESKNILSKINTANKDDFLKEFIRYYNEKSCPTKGFLNNIVNQLPQIMKTIFSNDKLRTFINRIKNVENFSSDIQEDINNLLFDVVDTYYHDSHVIKINYKQSTQ